MKYLVKPFILLALSISCMSALAAGNSTNTLYAHTTGNVLQLVFNKKSIEDLCAIHQVASCTYDNNAVVIGGRRIDKNTFVIAGPGGLDLIFDTLKEAESFRDALLKSVNHENKDNLKFYARANLFVNDVVLATFYREGGRTKYLVFPNKWNNTADWRNKYPN